MNVVLEPFRTIWRHKRLLVGTTIVELRSNYAGSVLGLSWVIVAPLLLMAIYAAVYLLIFRMSLPGTGPVGYVLLVCAGLSAYSSFCSALGAGASAVLRNKQVLVNAVFPAELLPVRAVLTAAPPLVLGCGALMLLAPIYGQGGMKLLFVPVVVGLQLMFMCGIAWILSLLTLLVRDVQHILQYVTTLLLIVTPIGYTIDMVPPTIAWMVRLNPLAHFVLAYQSLIVFDKWPTAVQLSAMTLMSIVTFLVGYWIFQKAKFALYDYA